MNQLKRTAVILALSAAVVGGSASVAQAGLAAKTWAAAPDTGVVTLAASSGMSWSAVPDTGIAPLAESCGDDCGTDHPQPSAWDRYVELWVGLGRTLNPFD